MHGQPLFLDCIELFLLQVREGGYDYKVNETVNAVTTKTTEIGQRTWGIMKVVMALASQKVEEYTNTKDGWNNDDWPRNDSEMNGYYQEFRKEQEGWNSSSAGQSSSTGNSNSYNSSSWDDWDNKGTTKEGSNRGGTSGIDDGWVGWDDPKDNGYDNFYQRAPSKNAVGHNGKSDATWTGGGFL
ncbi:probable ADP-ribosylation factor GTPase-activating protein AGD6 [Punica granatum]|uniref:Probable ADP-ribosylation factor GTPase-activating protein AGD6 n=1 Tax=Punica granatum TaxID=22663 RepID=A0A6P8DWS8_PUNGR|nr:probable ADP-ribosylation factor GTPase-activating protein AGD6 [Punica granatum]